ncbi:Na+/H+ antiporter NhaA [Chitinophaga sancti]|uniref:Na+/H+ antiporter NhaA n=1 Tax=Chitinophaga sancti TaxID=1004 RepID=UPI003F78BB1B
MAKTPIDHLLKPVSRFIHQEFTGGIVLFVSVIVAIIWANSPARESYLHLWETNLSVGFNNMAFDKPLHIWINDGLMALFFFVIGLELKREFMAGELSSVKKATLPMVAAVGGMLVPALIYVSINGGLPSAGGWGIPMATDIAFSLALLSLAGNRIPPSVKVFLSALAVADDLGAVLVIAFFYTANIAFFPLVIAGGVLMLMIIGNLLGIRHTAFYLILGIVVWGGFLMSGVHATIAGVLVAFTIPARPKIDEDEFLRDARCYADEFEVALRQDGSLISQEQLGALEKIKQLSLDAETPLQKIENILHPWVAFIIMPLFALANSGMVIGNDFFSSLVNPVSLGIMFGLVCGKFIGVFSFTWLMVKMKMASLPLNAKWMHICGIAILAGIGFTMSLFITGLAFAQDTFVTQAKYGILVASFFAGAIGLVVLRRIK